LEWEVPHPEGVSKSKMVNFHSGIIELQMCPNSGHVKHTLHSHTPALAACTWPHDTLYLDIYTTAVSLFFSYFVTVQTIGKGFHNKLTPLVYGSAVG